ncbi:MAG: bacillithiol biosynthesis deacetylase BshB1 [Flavobacteriaceae bacterium]|nr:bacillithiol biosynthesis deacetylase BshB1 [Flavobacteriaceae bacterium]
MKLDILAFGAHPDDVELGAGATIAKAVGTGKKVGVIDLTRGELGTRGSAELRAIEAANAQKILGVAIRENLGFADGFFVNDKTNQLAIIKKLRRFRPEIVLCNPPHDRHIDHGKAGQLVQDACFLSGLSKIDTGQEPWRPKNIFQYIQWLPLEPDFVVDVGDYIFLKEKAVLAYSSQFFDANSEEPSTPISSKNFLDSIQYRARDLGRIIGKEYAEGFIAPRMLAVDNLDQLL